MYCDAKELKWALKAALAATDDTGIRPALACVHIVISKHALIVTGIDGFSLVRTRVAIIESEITTPVIGLIQGHDVTHLIKQLKGTQIDITLTPTSWRFGSQYGVSVPLQDYHYPDIAKALEPMEAAKPATMLLVDPSRVHQVLRYAPSCVRMQPCDIGLRISGDNYRAFVMYMTLRADDAHMPPAFTHLEAN